MRNTALEKSSDSSSSPKQPYDNSFHRRTDHSPDDVEFDDLAVPCPPHTTERALMRKIDRRLLPMLCLLYLMAFLDRTNIGNAAIFGLQKDLKLKGNEFNAALTVFFVPYVLFEIPSNIILKRLRPRVWLPVCMFLFGLVTTLQGLVQNYSGLIAARFFLGLFEAGMFPGCFYLIGMWYKRSEAQRRYSLFFSSTQLAAAFGGLLASAIGKMDGKRGYHAWRWIFILEGLLTCVVAFGAYFLISDFPEQATWLTEEERIYINGRLRADQGSSTAERSVTFHDVVQVFKDYKVILGGLMYFALIVPAYGLALFSPTIIQTYGYTPIQTQLHSVPPIAAAFVFSLLIAFASDKLRHRFLFVLAPICLAITGVAILLRIHDSPHTEYAALFLVAMGTYAAMPVVICWFTMNLRGHHARGVGTAWQIGFGNIGGIVATFAFLAKDAPQYRTGYALLLGFFCLGAVSAAAYFAAVWWGNRAFGRRFGVEVKEGEVHSGKEMDRAEVRDDGYRYML